MPKDQSNNPQNNNQWNHYKAAQQQPPQPDPIPPQPTRYSDKAFLHTPMAAVGVPLLIAFITALAIMAGTAAFIYLINGYEYLKPMIATGMATFVFTWLALQFRWISLTQLENKTNIDINGDGRIGEPVPARVTSTIQQVNEVTEQGHLNVSQNVRWSASPAQLKAICIGLHDNGMSLSERDWSPIEQGRPFSIGQIRKLKAEMIENGIIVMVNGKNKSLGFTETRAGQRMIESWREFEDDISHWTLSPSR